jgi:signal transduction histidine kinase
MMEKYPGIEHTPFFSVLRRCMDERVPEIVENEFTYPDGTKGWFELSIQPAPEGVIILSMDITRRKLAEEKLIQSERQIRNFATRLTKTVEDERARIARELHDELSGQLAGLKMGLSSLKTNHRELTEPIDQLMKNADDAMHAVRKVIADLRPAMLDSLGFIPSLDWLAKEFQKKSGITCRVEAEEEIQIDNGDAISIFRICQEALTNVLKHSEASKVTITLKKENEKIILKIKDNGKGIQSEKLANPFSVGLIGMRERARMINAEFSISSEKNVGTTIILSKLAAEPRRTEIVSSN